MFGLPEDAIRDAISRGPIQTRGEHGKSLVLFERLHTFLAVRMLRRIVYPDEQIAHGLKALEGCKNELLRHAVGGALQKLQSCT